MATTLVTAGGNALIIGNNKVNCVSSALPGSNVVFGHAGTYYSQPYQAYSGMWGTYIPTNSNMIYSVDLATLNSTFPNNTTFEWDIVPDPRYAGIEGYLALSYGNYDDNAVAITSRQLKNITTLSLNVSWAYGGNSPSGLLSECYITTTSHASGPVSGSDPVAEVAFFPHNSAGTQNFIQSLPSVGTGSFTDMNGVLWNVCQAVSGVGPIPYYVASRAGYIDHQGSLDFKSLFNFLTTSGKITGNEWFNGVAFGVEPYGNGAGQLTINSFAASYS